MVGMAEGGVVQLTPVSAREGSVPSMDGGQRRSGQRGLGRRAFLFGRFLSAVIALLSVLWLVRAVPVSNVDAGFDLRLVAASLLDGEAFPQDILERVEADGRPLMNSDLCPAQGLLDLAVVRIALVEAAFEANDAEVADRRLTEAAEASRKSLTCSPASSVPWTILAWIEFIRDDDTPKLHALLEMSYRTGPYNGWALLRRSDLLLHIYPALSDREQAQLRSQLNWLIASTMVQAVAARYVAAAPPQRAFLRGILADAGERDQKLAAEFIRKNGEDIDLPAVEPLGARPWR